MNDQKKSWVTLSAHDAASALGSNPYKSSDDLVRQMVRAHHGLDREFISNPATEYGSLHEPLAVMDYMAESGYLPSSPEGFTHPHHDWIAAHTRTVEDGGIVNIACPYGQASNRTPEFKPSKDDPRQYSKIQMQMACTGRKWAHHFQWSQFGQLLEVVEFDDKWWADSLPVLLEFYHIYLNDLNNKAHLSAKVLEINTLVAKRLIDELNEVEERKKLVLSDLVKITKGREALLCGRRLEKDGAGWALR